MPTPPKPKPLTGKTCLSISHDNRALLSSLTLEKSDDLLVAVLAGIIKRSVLPPVYGVHVHVTLVYQELHHV